jgi:hypothetical protein
MVLSTHSITVASSRFQSDDHAIEWTQLKMLTGYLMDNTFVYVRFEVFTAVTMKNGVCWDVTPCGSCKN